MRSVIEGAPLLAIGRWLQGQGYRFTTVTPETHRRVNARSGPSRSVRDVFGWSRPFEPSLLPQEIVEGLRRANALVERDGALVSRVRFSTLGTGLYVHSAYPTVDEDAVFFGPDTYRFCAALARGVARATRVVDVGCGSGVGGLSLADRVERIVLTDINPQALEIARVNAELAGVLDRVELVEGNLYSAVTGPVDLIVANPPYLVDAGRRTYRDGGAELGTQLGIRMVTEGLSRLAPGGRLMLYTGTPVVDGVDRVRTALERVVQGRSIRWTYEEVDPDVFGEELEQPDYAAVERIAAVVAWMTVDAS